MARNDPREAGLRLASFASLRTVRSDEEQWKMVPQELIDEASQEADRADKKPESEKA